MTLNIFPSLRKPKIHFTNPLSGSIYNNNNFLQSCQYERMQPIQTPKQKKQVKKHSVITEFQKIDNKLAQQENLVLIKNQKEQLFPLVSIIALDCLKTQKDLEQKIIILNFQKYYLSFFKKSLSGSLSTEFLKEVEKYMRFINQNNTINQEIPMLTLPKQLFTLKSKKKFLQKLNILKQKQLYSHIEALIKFYCIPGLQFRQSCLRDILLALALQIYQKFNCRKDRKYLLMDQKGKIITDICQIYFSTKRLFLTSEQNAQKNYKYYMNLMEQLSNKHQKLSFSQNIKQSFRKKITKGHFQESCFLNPIQVENKNMQRAQQIIMQRNKSKEYLASARARSVLSQHRHTTFDFFKTHRRSKSKISHLNNDNNKSVGKIEKSNSINKIEKWKSSFDKQVQKQFSLLRLKNDRYDITFNHDPSNEKYILTEVLKNQFVVFTNRKKQIILNILKASKIDPQGKSVSFQQFYQLRGIISAKAPKQSIMNFVGNYLSFNQYGELTREALAEIIRDIVNCNANNKQVIVEVIWSWLGKNKLLEQNVIRRSTLESWFEINKLVYMLLISLIFGTNEVTPLQMAFQILV